MSRRIEFSDPAELSDEDRAYLLARGRVNVVAQLKHLAAIDAQQNHVVANERIAKEKNRRRDLAAAARKKEPVVEIPTVEVLSDDEVPPYEEWSRDELLAECRERELDTTGNNKALIARLYQDDNKDA